MALSLCATRARSVSWWSGALITIALLVSACSSEDGEPVSPTSSVTPAAAVTAAADGGTSSAASDHPTGTDEDAIRHVMMAEFDRPEAPLTVEPVTVEGDFAVAAWSQGEEGGRALVRRHEGAWVVWLCSGEGMKDASLLVDAGMEHAAAERLVAGFQAAEATLPADVVARFDNFDGVVMVQGDGHGESSGHPGSSNGATTGTAHP